MCLAKRNDSPQIYFELDDLVDLDARLGKEKTFPQAELRQKLAHSLSSAGNPTINHKIINVALSLSVC